MEIDSIHFYVKNANLTSLWFVAHLGFKLVDRYQDKNNLTIAVACASVLLIISSPLKNQGVIAAYLDHHPEGVVDIAFRIEDLQTLVKNRQSAFNSATLQPISVVDISSAHRVIYSAIAGWGSLRHTLLTSNLFHSCYSLPNGDLRIIPVDGQKQQPSRQKYKSPRHSLQFTQIDHVVLNVARGHLQAAVNYYQNLFAWNVQQSFEITTQHSGLSSQALIDATEMVQFNINEPTTTNSQIQEFIDLNQGAGIQHLALRSQNLVTDVAKLRDLGVDFLPIPDAYYTQLRQEFREWEININLDLNSVAKQAILVDCQSSNLPINHHKSNPDALLLQIFTQPILERPTFFLEFIERRHQVKGFGEGNFHALFAAVEAEQVKSLR